MWMALVGLFIYLIGKFMNDIFNDRNNYRQCSLSANK